MTQSEMRKSAISALVAEVAAAWRAWENAPRFDTLMCEEDRVTVYPGKTLLSREGRWSTYNLNHRVFRMEDYRLALSRLQACKEKSARFRQDGLGIWRI